MHTASTSLCTATPHATFLLVPGAWCGGWCWDAVATRLRHAGHRAIPLTLSGVAERAHLLSPSLSLETHVQDILHVLAQESAAKVILVGHSYAGVPMTVVADRVPQRLAHLVFLDALLPNNGECGFDLFPQRIVLQRLQSAALYDGGLSLPVPPSSVAVQTPEQTHFRSQLTPQPLAPYTERLRLRHSCGNGVPATYVTCLPQKLPACQRAAHRAQQRGWRVLEVESGHNVHLHRPQEITAILLDCAAPSEDDPTSPPASTDHID